jgi:hypothetical protein
MSGNLEVHVGFARSPDAFASDEFFSPLLALSVRCWPTMRTGNPGLATNMPTHTFSSARGDLHAFPTTTQAAHMVAQQACTYLNLIASFNIRKPPLLLRR